jgi:hypothetical protein
MTAGGYIFRKVDLTYDPNTNGATILDWAKAIHEARCQAFFDAAKAYYTSIGEPYGWYTLASQGYGNTYTLINLGSNPLFVTQDIHDSTNTPANADYPALLTVFTDEVSGSYYYILTYRSCNSYSDYQNDPINYGLYLPGENILHGSSYVYCGGSLSHGFAKSGGIITQPINIKDSNFLINNCTHIMAAFAPCGTWSSSQNIDYYSLLYDRVNNGQNSSNLIGKTFQFGYAIKGEQIIAMMRESSNRRWLWSIIGDIFGTTMSNDDKTLVGGLINDYYTDGYSEISTGNNGLMSSNDIPGRLSFCKSNGDLYRPASNYITLNYTRSSQYSISPCVRTNTIIPDDTLYNAVTAGAYVSSYSNITGDTGVDGQGNGCKGFIDTDLLRMVSAGVCQNAGTLFNGGNFVSMFSPNSDCQVGYILGWDPSNESIL